MIDTEPTTCKYPLCGRPIVQLSGGHRKRFYCDAVCKMRDRRRQEYEAQQAKMRADLAAQLAEMHARWTGLLAETQQVLEDVLQLHSVGLASRVAVAVRSEVAHAKDDAHEEIAALHAGMQELQERLAIEERFRTDVKVRHFKAWLKRQPQSQGSDWAKRFLADTRLRQHDSRSMYEAQMRLHGYSAEDITLFQDVWKTMLLFQS